MLVLKDSKFKCIVEVSFANWDNTALQNEIIKVESMQPINNYCKFKKLFGKILQIIITKYL